MNNQLSKQIGLTLAVFNPSLIIYIEMIALALCIVIMASFLPVKRITVMKPIDAINNK